jgi:hypothetical protein
LILFCSFLVRTKDEVEDGENMVTEIIESKRKNQSKILAERDVVDCKYTRRIPPGFLSFF